MNGAQDLGGQHGFGRVEVETDEPMFHADWEKRALAVTLMMGPVGRWTLDQSRHARETLPPVQYLSSSYYEIWIAGLEKLMAERGIVDCAEIEAEMHRLRLQASASKGVVGEGTAGHEGAAGKGASGKGTRDEETPGEATTGTGATGEATGRTGNSSASASADLAARRVPASAVPGILARGGPTERPAAAPARFKVGDAVRTRVMNPSGHTRLPRYARGRRGTIAIVHGVHVYPDASGNGLGEDPHWLYTVRFDGRELWGSDGSAAAVHADCWEPYLEPL